MENKSILETVAHHMGDPVALVLALIIGGFAASGKFSVTVTQLMFFMAWIVAIVSIRDNPPLVIVGVGAVFAFGLMLLAYYARPEVIPQYFGTLTPQRRLLFSWRSPGLAPVLEIGNSTATITWKGEAGKPLFSFFGDSALVIEIIRGKVKVSTTIRDERGKLVAELVRNEWRVSPPPNTFDRNYTDDSLEVRNAEGLVVLQVRVLPDRIQLQGEWRGKNGEGFRLVAVPNGGGGLMIPRPKGFQAGDQNIQAIFEYPSDTHFGELRK